MATGHRLSDRNGILVRRFIECSVCRKTANSFRLFRLKNLRSVDAEFYHDGATCAGALLPKTEAALDLLRLALETRP